MENNLYVSPSPHIHGGDSISKDIYGVLIVLIPAFLTFLHFFGLGALIVTVVSALVCMILEYLIRQFLMKKEPTLCDDSAILTDVLLAFNLPSNLPVWIIIIRVLAAIGTGKMSFGGLGNSIFSPALIRRVFLLISLPAQMTTWPVVDALNIFPMTYTDAQTGAMILLLTNKGMTELPSYGNMFVGAMGGNLGGVSAVALILGLSFMLQEEITTWWTLVSILVIVFVFTGVMRLVNPVQYISSFVRLLSGDSLLGSVLMVANYVTSSMSKNGMLVYGVGTGVLTTVIRLFRPYPEGMSFATLITNTFTPLISSYVRPKRFGGR